MYVKRWSLSIFIFRNNRPKKRFFQDFSRLENDKIFFHTFPDCVGTLSVFQTHLFWCDLQSYLFQSSNWNSTTHSVAHCCWHSINHFKSNGKFVHFRKKRHAVRNKQHHFTLPKLMGKWNGFNNIIFSNLAIILCLTFRFLEFDTHAQ